MIQDTIKIVAMVATRQREQLLFGRAIPSIQSQSYPADNVVVIEDQPTTSEIKMRLKREMPLARYLKNRRTQGLSGALNSGIDQITRENRDNLSRVYIAFLDDDDYWTPDHIEAVMGRIRVGAEVIATPFWRIETGGAELAIFPPTKISPRLFMERNPGIQGSNLVVRLDVLLKAGSLNEGLQACTDRDLLIRICNRPNLKFATTSEPSVKHYACSDRARLSTPKSENKIKGLDMFYRIHGPHMPPEVEKKFLKRSLDKFQWQPDLENRSANSSKRIAGPPEADTPPLVVGVIVDHRRIDSASELLKGLAERVKADNLGRPDVLLFHNRPAWESDAEFLDMVRGHRDRLNIHTVGRDAIEKLIDSGEWESDGINVHNPLAIADARSLLQAFLYHLAKKKPGCAIWILDDDMRFDPLVETENGSEPQQLELGKMLRRMQALKLEENANIFIGEYTDAAPIPAFASTEPQIFDLLWNLRRLDNLEADDPVPSPEPYNTLLRANHRDYYNALSRGETDRLLTPFAIEPDGVEETCSSVRKRLVEMIPRILAGEAPLRPLLADPVKMEEFTTSKVVNRGGNTVILDANALAVPNLSPVVNGRPTRRSDTLWADIQVKRFDNKVYSVPFPMRQDRRDLDIPTVEGWKNQIVDDLHGYAVVRACQEAGDSKKKVEDLFEKYKEERLAAFRLSFYHMMGMSEELLAWDSSDPLRDEIVKHAKVLLGYFTEDMLEHIEDEVCAFNFPDVRKFLAQIDSRIERHAEWVRDPVKIPRLLDEARISMAKKEERIARAKSAVIAEVDSDDIRVLGNGSEGVVFTDGHRVWKLFDNWTEECEARAAPLLEGLVNNPAVGGSLLKPLAMRRTPDGWLLTLPFESTEKYEGGHGPGLVELIADLHRAGLTCRNFHPKNLRVAGDSVRLIDYGESLQLHDDPEAIGKDFLRMCQRAWLCWRWWWRSDIKTLMRKSLDDPNLPELSGYENLVQAVRERLGLVSDSDPTLTRSLELRPSRVLDYGAGKGKEAATLAKSGAEVVAWDPDSALTSRLDALNGVSRAATASEAISSGPYDLVICRRVACLLENDELIPVLRDLREAVEPDGTVLLTLCHPAYAHRVRVAQAEPTPEPIRDFDPKCRMHGMAFWEKRVRSTGRILHEVHRSEKFLRRLAAREGFRVVGRHERSCIEFDRFETVADLLVFELVPAPKPEVSLLIKACAMDAEALEIQVSDMLVALEGQGTFREVVLTLDTRTDNFPREHNPGDMDALRQAARRLQLGGEVNRIVETPSDPDELRSLNRRWFGLDIPASHSALSAATGALLTGFDACTASRVLHADCDIMIGRAKPALDPVSELTEALDNHPEAVTAGFPIAQNSPRSWTAEGNNGPWRVESRIGMVDIERMKAILPLPNFNDGGVPRLSWHRAMDEAVKQGKAKSLRGGDGRAFFIHPQNERKSNISEWEEIRASVARGHIPPVQYGEVEWSGNIADWRIPERNERFVFVICGRNVMPERFRRCWDSVLRQNRKDWGAVIIDDASAPWVAEEIGRILEPHADRVSFIPRRRRAGLLANTVHAIRHICASPEQIIITLDADDHLIGREVLDRLAVEYDGGADLTVGSMLRTDKLADYPARFDNPRLHRGGNVWQHLRSFKKYLFDAVPDDALRLDGEYIDLATDWAFMVPMVELAQKPVWIREPLYLHEPGAERSPARKVARERIITRIMEMVIFGKYAAE